MIKISKKNSCWIAEQPKIPTKLIFTISNNYNIKKNSSIFHQFISHHFKIVEISFDSARYHNFAQIIDKKIRRNRHSLHTDLHKKISSRVIVVCPPHVVTSSSSACNSRTIDLCWWLASESVNLKHNSCHLYSYLESFVIFDCYKAPSSMMIDQVLRVRFSAMVNGD